jgi:hypothetical protein
MAPIENQFQRSSDQWPMRQGDDPLTSMMILGVLYEDDDILPFPFKI